MEEQAAYGFMLALFLAMALIPPLVRVAGPLGLIDAGGGRKVHAGLIPRTGGVAIYVGFLVPVLLWVPLRQDLRAFLIGSGILFAFGVLDDRFNLDYRLKLLGQVVATLVVTLFGGVLIERVAFLPGGILPEAFSLPFTVFVLVGITNAVNLSDGLDGLAGGVSLLAMSCLFLFAYNRGDGAVVMVALAVIGATFGFLRFNSFPARLFMGDSGSQLLGFSSGVLAVIVTQHSDPALSPVVPILLLGVPILDTLLVMGGRVARGQSPFQADRTHLHHRMLASGLNQREAVSLVYIAQFLLVVLAYLLRYSADSAILLTYGIACVLILVGLKELERRRPYLTAREEHDSLLVRLTGKARRTRFFTQGPFLILSSAIPGFLMLGALMVPSVSLDIGLLAAVSFFALLAALLFQTVPFFLAERLTAYVAAATVTFLVGRSEGLMGACLPCIHLFFGLIALVTAFWVRFSSGSFKVSALDILILLLALAAPGLQGLGFRDLGVVALESVILFYGIEVVLHERERHWDVLRIGVLCSLAIIAVKGLLT